MAPNALHPALHPCLNQVSLNEINSNGQIKPSEISLDDKGEKIWSKLSVSWTQRT